jgi:hypothetical protein
MAPPRAGEKSLIKRGFSSAEGEQKKLIPGRVGRRPAWVARRRFFRRLFRFVPPNLWRKGKLGKPAAAARGSTGLKWDPPRSKKQPLGRDSGPSKGKLGPAASVKRRTCAAERWSAPKARRVSGRFRIYLANPSFRGVWDAVHRRNLCEGRDQWLWIAPSKHSSMPWSGFKQATCSYKCIHCGS